jgi:cytochrome c
MKYVSGMVAIATLTRGFWAGSVQAQVNGTRDEAKTMVEAAVEHVRKAGPEQAFKDFTDKGNTNWQKKDLYVFAYNMAGVNVAHGTNDKLVGKDLIALKDPEGELLIKELRDTAAKGSGWVEYEWPHRRPKRSKAKSLIPRSW